MYTVYIYIYNDRFFQPLARFITRDGLLVQVLSIHCRKRPVACHGSAWFMVVFF